MELAWPTDYQACYAWMMTQQRQSLVLLLDGTQARALSLLCNRTQALVICLHCMALGMAEGWLEA